MVYLYTNNIKTMNPTADLIKIKSELLLKNINMQTISENEVLSLLSNELPEMQVEIKKISNKVSIYNVISCFADFTRQLANVGDLKEVKHCFNVAEKIWTSGNNTVKNAIENSYLFSLSSLLDLNCKIKDMLNAPLKREYNRQVFGSGI